MLKFLKTYCPMVLSLLFLMVYVMLIMTTTSYEYLLDDMNSIFGVGLVIIILFLIEWIYFIIKAATNKDKINNALWAVLIYLFNVFIIPYYNFKYVVKTSKLKLNMTIYIVLTVISCIVGGFIPNIYSKTIEPVPLILYSDDFKFQFTYNGYYEEVDSENFDIYVKDDYRDISSGAIIYNKEDSENINSENILEAMEQGVLKTSSNVDIGPTSVEKHDDKTITTNIYTEPGGSKKLIYIISTVEFEGSSYIVNFIQIVRKGNYSTIKDELNNNLYNVDLVGLE